VVVPQVSQEPLFLDRTGVVRKSRSEMIFICVPVIVNDRRPGRWGSRCRSDATAFYDQEVQDLGIALPRRSLAKAVDGIEPRRFRS